MVGGKNLNILNRDEEARISKLIAQCELETTGEIHVHMAHHTSSKGVLEDARKAFIKLGMHRKQDRNGVMIYISLKDHEIACIGDEAIHSKVGKEFWDQCVEFLQHYFKNGDFFLGLYKSIEMIASSLTQHFPALTGAAPSNELSNEISKG